MRLYQVHETVERVRNAEAMYFCRLQVSKKFARTASDRELQLISHIVSSYDHRVLHGAENLGRVAAELQGRIKRINEAAENDGQKLSLVVVPLTAEQNGYIVISRNAGRHQQLMLPIIDFQGSVVFDEKGGSL